MITEVEDELSFRKCDIMIITIITSVFILLFSIFILGYRFCWKKQNYYLIDIFEFGTILTLILSCMSLFACIILVSQGYKEPKHLISKDSIISLYDNPETLYDAIKYSEEYNRIENECNNYWCRFALRETDIIDIEVCIINGCNH